MRILFSITDLKRGGSQLFFIRLVNAFSKEHSLAVVSIRADIDPDVRGELAEEIHLFNPGQSKMLSRWDQIKHNSLVRFLDRRLGLEFRLKKRWFEGILKDFRPELISSFMFHSDSFLSAVLQKSRIPLAISIRGCYSLHQYENRDNGAALNYLYQQYRAVFERADAFTWQTLKNLELFDWIGGKPEIPNRKIFNGLQKRIPGATINRETYGITDDSLIVGMIARGAEYKGWEALLEAFTQLDKEDGQGKAVLLLGGDSDYVRKLHTRYEGNPSLIFAGSIRNPIDFIALFDIAVCASHVDSMPNSVIEYLSLEKAIISTSVGEIPEMLKAGEEQAGILIGLDDEGRASVEGLKNSIRVLLASKSERDRLSSLSAEAFKKFDMEQCYREFEAFFTELVQTKK